MPTVTSPASAAVTVCGGDRWAVVTPYRESVPSERRQEWLAGHRFDLDTAIGLARATVVAMEVAGETAVQMLTRTRAGRG